MYRKKAIGRKIPQLFNAFFESEKSGGLSLVFVTALSLLLANSIYRTFYIDFWHFNIQGNTTSHWINDGLMTIFFLLIGLELEREIYVGQLADIKRAALPIFGAIGGMILPAVIFYVCNFGLKSQNGIGIPMATDIAFAIGILSLLGKSVPVSLKVFLTALAVIDDLGAIIIIAIFYTKTIVWTNLGIAIGIWIILLLLNRAKVKNLIPYLLGGIIMWFFMLHSGIHATITGVMLAFTIPFGSGNRKSASFILQKFLHKPVAFVILPLFALANTAIEIPSDWKLSITQNLSFGIMLGLVFGKPIGILLFSWLGVKFGYCSLPKNIKWKHIFGVGFLGGIGFTMSIFVTLLAFDDDSLINQAKMAIIIGSSIGALFGFLYLKKIYRHPLSKSNIL